MCYPRKYKLLQWQIIKGANDFRKIFVAGVQVAQRGRNAVVTQQLLFHHTISSLLNEVRGKGMPQQVASWHVFP